MKASNVFSREKWGENPQKSPQKSTKKSAETKKSSNPTLATRLSVEMSNCKSTRSFVSQCCDSHASLHARRPRRALTAAAAIGLATCRDFRSKTCAERTKKSRAAPPPQEQVTARSARPSGSAQRLSPASPDHWTRGSCVLALDGVAPPSAARRFETARRLRSRKIRRSGHAGRAAACRARCAR